MITIIFIVFMVCVTIYHCYQEFCQLKIEQINKDLSPSKRQLKRIEAAYKKGYNDGVLKSIPEYWETL